MKNFRISKSLHSNTKKFWNLSIRKFWYFWIKKRIKKENIGIETNHNQRGHFFLFYFYFIFSSVNFFLILKYWENSLNFIIWTLLIQPLWKKKCFSKCYSFGPQCSVDDILETIDSIFDVGKCNLCEICLNSIEKMLAFLVVFFFLTCKY